MVKRLIMLFSMGPKTMKISPSKGGTHPWTQITFTLITTYGTWFHTLGEFTRWCL